MKEGPLLGDNVSIYYSYQSSKNKNDSAPYKVKKQDYDAKTISIKLNKKSNGKSSDSQSNKSYSSLYINNNTNEKKDDTFTQYLKENNSRYEIIIELLKKNISIQESIKDFLEKKLA